MAVTAVAPPRASVRAASQRHTLFALGWGLAALFHLAGNPRPPFAQLTPAVVIVQAAVGLAALIVCLAPRRLLPLVVLCVLVPLSAWFEAPVIGNHWVLAAAISLVYLLAVAVSRRRRGSVQRSHVWTLFAPAARLTLLAAYAFAAFAKLNTGFLDPATSCAVFFQDQIVRSWGLASLSIADRPALGLAAAVGAAAVELSVPVLLALRRTRRLGILLALSFHWFLALDLAQHFWDFSAVLFAAFLLFLDDGQVRALASYLVRLRNRTRTSVRLLAVTLGVVAGLIAIAAAVTPPPGIPQVLGVLTGHAAWWVIGTGTVLLVLAATMRSRTHEPGRVLAVSAPVMLLVPVVVVLNGLTPYLELKTGFGWNMYSNLRTAAGESNHLVVPATLDLTGQQSDLVDILSTSDPALEELVGSGYAVVYSEFLEYAALNPDTAVRYTRDAETFDVDRLGDEPEFGTSPDPVSWRLQSFRVVDVSGAERCLPVYSPGR